MYEERHYRRYMGSEEITSFEVSVKETDLWIGIDSLSYSPDIKNKIREEISGLRKIIEDYISCCPKFMGLEPLEVSDDMPPEAADMSRAGVLAGVGPMAGVAGMFAQHIGNKIVEWTNCSKLLIENGGDIYLFSHEPVTVSIFAGDSPFSGNTGITLFPKGGIGVCTSSGTVGHSYSAGQADAVVVISRDTVAADAYATSFCNEILNAADVSKVLERAKDINLITGIVIIIDDKIAAWGDIKLIDLRNEKT